MTLSWEPVWRSHYHRIYCKLTISCHSSLRYLIRESQVLTETGWDFFWTSALNCLRTGKNPLDKKYNPLKDDPKGLNGSNCRSHRVSWSKKTPIIQCCPEFWHFYHLACTMCQCSHSHAACFMIFRSANKSYKNVKASFLSTKTLLFGIRNALLWNIRKIY